MNAPVDDRYFEWLCGLVGSVRNRNPARTFWRLQKQLYTTEFTWFVPNDDNRIEDGRDLRYEFLDMRGSDGVTPGWMGLGCSVLEMLIALARRASYESDKTPDEWYWLFLTNLDLKRYTDSRYDVIAESDVEHILRRFINRTYAPNGKGGIFPLRHHTRDQRKTELWYQMSAYLLEGEEPPNAL